VLTVKVYWAVLTGVLMPAESFAATLSVMPAGGATVTTVTTGVPAAAAFNVVIV